MKIHFKGIYKGKDDEQDYLDKYCAKEHKPGAVKLPEAKKFFDLKANILSGVVILLFSFIFCFRYQLVTNSADLCFFLLFLALFCVLSTILLPVHEILHTVFNKQDSIIYFYPKHLCMFVVNVEEKTKFSKISEFLFPNLILGFIPFIIAIIFPQLKILGFFAIPNIVIGTADYMNIFRFLRYIPNGAKIYTHIDDGVYWYKP